MEFSHRDTSSHLFVQALAINILIFLLVFVKADFEWVAEIGGVVIIGYIFIKGLFNPKEAIYLFIGIKLTFDALWEIKIYELAGIGKIGLLELMILPVILLTFVGNKMSRSLPKWPVGLLIVYLAWVFCAMLINEESFVDFNLLVRQTCLLFGLIFGLKYVETIEDFQKAAYLVFLSSIIPVFLAFLQSIAGPSLEQLFFHSKMDYTRGIRISGLFYDSGTMGMVVIISLATNLYLLQSGLVKRGFRSLHFIFIPVCIFIAIAGGTRSIIFISFALVVVFLVTNIKRAVLILPLILLVITLSGSFLDKVILKTANEDVMQTNLTELLETKESRTMFTGRVGLWQDIWDKQKSGTWGQQLLGSGLSSNAHSTYFFLLLQIGWLGLMFYLFYNLLMIKHFIRAQLPRMFILTLLSAIISNLLMGIAAATVNYTSFQILISFITGAGIAIAATSPSEGTHSV